MTETYNFPRQMLPFSQKTKEWRKKCVLWANQKTFFNYSPVRKSVQHKKINMDLLNGKIHMQDLRLVINPDNQDVNYIPDTIQHYAIINSKLNVLRGEEASRSFDYRVIVTNPDAISEVEKNKKAALMQDMDTLIRSTSISQEDYQQKAQELTEYYSYEWQDLREIRANCLLNHYSKEYNMKLIFNVGFVDAMTHGEEMYQCDIVGGEPVIKKLNPLKVRVFRSGYSNKIEDADMIILEDYWSPGQIIDAYYDVLSEGDIKYLETCPDNVGQSPIDEMGNLDERFGFINQNMISDVASTNNGGFYLDPTSLFSEGMVNSLMPYDLAGNIRVLRLYWKSKRKVLKVTSFNQETGEEEQDYYPENYKVNKALGETAEAEWINEAWEGTMIGEKIFVNMRPRLVQYNRISNPSRCHFGIVGSIYNLDDSRPFSLVDIMKPYNYLYDAIHDRLNKAIARNWGKIITLDFAKMPKGWDVDKWMYYAKINGIAVIDSFKEGTIGAATGKLAGGLNNATSGVIDAETGNYIQQQINLLEFIKLEMSEVGGISKQREGQIGTRETVGGVERSTLQSSYITEWLFTIHSDVKRRVLECFLETSKIALKGKSKKFQYLLSDGSARIMDIDGDEYAENDYGLAVDDSQGTQELNQKLDTLAQAALQNQLISFSSLMKLYTTTSLADKQRMIEREEQATIQRKQQEQQQQMQMNQQTLQSQEQQKESELQQKELENQRDNQTKLLIAQLTSPDNDGIPNKEYNPKDRAELLERMREFDANLKLEQDKLTATKEKSRADIAVKRAANNKFVMNKK